MELLVSITILLLILLTVVSIVNQTSSIWSQTLSKVAQFRESRDGFEAINRRLSQATLNTYWDYDNPTTPTRYIRQSELRFICGPNIVGSGTSTPPRPTHAVFFQAPLGFVVPLSGTDSTYKNYQGMENLLNSWGYYVEYNNDSAFRPSFLTSPSRTRFRLMEFTQSSQSPNSLYPLEMAAGGNASYVYSSIGQAAWSWFLNDVNATLSQSTAQTAPVHILAENVLALIILPKLTPATEAAGNYTDSSLAPTYLYDSTGSNGISNSPILPDPNLNPTNQLPPIVQVTMVAIDETSALRMSAQQNQSIINELGALFGNSANYATDLAGGAPPPGVLPPAGGGLEPFLTSMRINFRVFTTDVSIKGAKWSAYQAN